MRIKGKKVVSKSQEVIPFPRAGGDIILIADAVQDWKEFDALLPEPQPPEKLKPGGVKLIDKQDPVYIKQMDEYAEQRTNYLVIASLQNTPDLEWETVDIKKPSTWGNYRKEMIESGFTEIEIGRLLRGVMRANSLDEDMIEEARSNFLHGSQGSEKSN
jgi:hypothetical protein